MTTGNDMSVFQAEHQRESDLINNRITWLLATQTVLLSVLSIGNNSSASSSPVSKLQDTVRCIIPWVGLWVTICLLLGIIGAYIALCKLEKLKDMPSIYKTKQGFPRLFGQIASIGVAIGILFTWIYILFCK